MTQLHFGQSDKPLYGVYHPPASAERKPAVLLCNPFGVEAIRAQRVFRVLATHLAQAGFPVLRFDYYGTGDASGDCTEFSLTSAVQDIMTAHQELIDMSGATRVIWLGLRLGAGLALQTADQIDGPKPRGLAGLVLWDAVLSGEKYHEEIKQGHVSELAQIFDVSPTAMLKKIDDKTLQTQSLGFAISETLRQELQDFDVAEITSRPARSVCLVADQGREDMQNLAMQFEQAKVKLSVLDDPESQSWNSDAALNAFVVPVKTIKLIVAAAQKIR